MKVPVIWFNFKFKHGAYASEVISSYFLALGRLMKLEETKLQIKQC
jgi:hypothetical protein